MPNEIRNGTHRVYGDTGTDSLGSGKRVSGGRRLTIAALKTTVEVSNYHSCCAFRFPGLKSAPSEAISLRYVIDT